MNLLSVFFSKKILIPALLALLVLFIYSLWGRIPDIDDAWIGEYAYWFAEDGYVHSELMRGVNGQEINFVVHHKLFNLNGALFIKLFGFSLYSLKSVSLLYFIVFLLLFYFYTCKWKKLFNKNDFLFSLVIIFSFPWIFKYSFLYRPEVMMMMFGFAGFILLEKFLDDNRRKYWQVVFSGMFFGLSMATHLNGIILITAGFILLVLNRKFKAGFVFGFGVLISFSIYFFDLTDIASLELWKHQFFDSPSLDSINANTIWAKPIINLLKEHMRYFHNLKIIAFSIFLISTLIVGFNYLRKNHTLLLQFAIIVAMITGVVAMHKSRQYLLLNFPYLVILIVLTIKAVYDGKISVFKIGTPNQIAGLLFILCIVFIGVSFYFNTHLAVQKFSPEQNRKIATTYTEGNESQMKIVSPMVFIFNEIENFKEIQGELCYVELQKMDSTVFGEGFLNCANDFGRDVIIITPYYQELLGISAYNKGDNFENYYVFDKNEELIVFKRKEKQPF